MKENKILEFKKTVTNTFLKTVSAYANFGDGIIKFGIDDDGNVCGIDNLKQACLDIENRINDSIIPKPDFLLSVNDKNSVITLRVSEGMYKPYLYKGKAYRRSDSATVEVDHIELQRLVLEGSNMSYEEIPTHVQDLSFSYLENIIKEKLHVDVMSDDVLRTLGLYTNNKEYNNVAELVADVNHFPGIDIAKFGSSISVIQDRETISGVSVFKQYAHSLEMYRRYYQQDVIEGFERKTIDLIPEEAFREAIANALVHRTWDIQAHIKVEMYEDRIVVISPGGLPKFLTKEEYMKGYISYLRNPILGNLFYRLHYIEMFGTGIRRILESYKSSVIKPSFDISNNAIRITLPVLSVRQSITLDAKTVLDSFDDCLELSAAEVSSLTGFSKNKTIRLINQLKDKGYLVSSGNTRNVRYHKL